MSKRIDDIEILRAIAILAVAIEHAEYNLITWHSPLFSWVLSHVRGWSGVDLFFTISGFVITRDLFPKLEASHGTLDFFRISLAFWIRRAWRLLPSAWFWLAFILLATTVFNRSGAFRSFQSAWEGTIAFIFQYANLRFAYCFGRYECGANFYYWSLSLEDQFYLLLPLAFFLMRRRWLPHILGLLILLQMSIAHRSLLLTNIRTDALLLGVLIALWMKTPAYRRLEPRFLAHSSLSRLAVLLALLYGLGTVTASSQPWADPYRFNMISILSGILVWIASYDRNYLLAIKSLKVSMLWIGARSYGIYLIHPIVYALTLEIWYRSSPKNGELYTMFDSSNTLSFVACAVLMILVFSEINYRLIEVPLRQKGQAISQRILHNGISGE